MCGKGRRPARLLLGLLLGRRVLEEVRRELLLRELLCVV